MEEPDVPWEMDEFWNEEETKDRSMKGWILNQGLVIGKKMLVTGMIISSAPVIVPPLVMMSALGFAVSVPYGIIWASYAWSEKLLDKLLPGTSPPFSLDARAEVREDYVFGGDFNIEEEQEKKDLNSWTEMNLASEGEPGGEVIERYQETKMYTPLTEQPVDMGIEAVVLTAEALEYDPRNSEIVVEETKVLTSGLGAEGRPVDSVPEDDKKLGHGVADKIEMQTEAKGNGKKSKRMGRKKEKFDKSKLPKASDETAEIKSGSAQPVTTGTDAMGVHPYQAKDDDEIKTSEKVQFHSPTGASASTVKGNSSEEVEAIWQRIEVVRQIVGYKAARQVTSMEELRALYLFTGMEPPISFKDPSDLEEVSEKLRFLLSVVGVE